LKKYTFKFVCDRCGYAEYVANPLTVKKDCPRGCGGTAYAGSTPVAYTENGKRR
jgi:hypothetical protein